MRVYLDHAATSPLRPGVLQAMLPYLTEPSRMGNPSSLHYEGRRAGELLEQCHDRVAALLNCKIGDVVFNSGGSEGDTHALLGAVRLHGTPCHLAISAFEHEAVEVAARSLVSPACRLSVIPVTSAGVVPLEAVEELLRGEDRPDVLSVMAVNNEVGTLQPVVEIAALCREREVLFHTDAVRAVGHGLPEIERCPEIALLNGTAHKFGGPRGVGVLIQRGLRLPQLICGGGQEHGCRAGTENLAGIAGLVAALELAMPQEAAHLEGLKLELERLLTERFPQCVIHGAAAPRATHVTSVAFPGVYNRELQAQLDGRGICVGTGKACHDAHAADNSGVLGAMGVPFELQRGTLRISLGWNTKGEDIEALVIALVELMPAMTAVG
jgi:cysteine desulfurase